MGEARRKLQADGHGAYPLVDGEGRCVGIIARGDLLRRPTEDTEPVTAVASRDVVCVSPEDTVFRALQLILEEEVEHLPVMVRGSWPASAPAPTSCAPAAASSRTSAASRAGGCWPGLAEK